MRLGLEFDAPFTRLLERNSYRESLIEYQRSRRDLINSRDVLEKGVRALLRNLEQRRLKLEIQRRAVKIAMRRVDQTQLLLIEPQGENARPVITPTTAINLLGAQRALQTSQNSFLATWLSYYAAKLRLYRELGLMQLDPQGRWIDSGIDEATPIPPTQPADSQRAAASALADPADRAGGLDSGIVRGPQCSADDDTGSATAAAHRGRSRRCAERPGATIPRTACDLPAGAGPTSRR